MKYSEIAKVGGFTQIVTGEGKYAERETVEAYTKYYGDKEIDPDYEICFRNGEAKIKLHYGVSFRVLATFVK